jgi:hypothetical protein
MICHVPPRFSHCIGLNYTLLYSFTGGADGCGPWTGVIRDASGNLFGTTDSCGKYGGGVLYELAGAK